MKDARVFISSSHRGRGQEWDAALLRALDVFHRHQLLDVWEDGRIRVSAFFDDDIKHAMAAAQAAVVLLTPEVLQSRYVLETEFPFLRERQQHDQLPVFPVVCEPCDWRAHDWLRATQAPNQSKPLSTLTPDKQDQIFRHLATEIAEHVSHRMLATLATADPLPEASIYLEQMPLTRGGGLREEKLIGREQELALLDLAFTQPGTALVSLVAWGGVGKTMLVQHWLQRLQREGWYGVKRVYAWSFFSQGTKEDRQASDDVFLAHALAWFGVHCEPTLSSWEKGRLLADIVTGERTLLILDGIEPLQYPPGPMGGQLRAPGVHSLLKHLARKANASDHRGLCLVTTREPLTDLTDFERRPGAAWGSVLRVDLGNLTDEAGAALLHHAGATRAGAAAIPADDLELLAASRDVKGHALTLHLLGRFLARAHGGDVRRCDLVHFDEADRQEQGGTTFKMLAAFEEWFARSGDFGARQLAVLRILGLFDRPADAGCLNALRQPPAIPGLTDPLFIMKRDERSAQEIVQPIASEDWSMTTSFLADFGLLDALSTPDARSLLLDCHPLIREYFAQLQRDHTDAWQSAHQRLYTYLRDATDQQPDTLEGIQPLYQALRHGGEGGLFQEARREILRDRIQRVNEYFSLHVLGAAHFELAAIRCFFDEPFTQPVLGLTPPERSLLTNLAGFCLEGLGRLEEARAAYEASYEITKFCHMFHANFKELATRAGNVSEVELLLGNIQAARRFAGEALQLADRSEEPFAKLSKRATLGHILLQAGIRSEVFELFQQAAAIQKTLEPDGLYSLQGFRFRNALLATIEATVWRAYLEDEPTMEVELLEDCIGVCRDVAQQALIAMEIDGRNDWSFDRALDNLCLACASLSHAVLRRRLGLDDGFAENPRLALDAIDSALNGLQFSGRICEIPQVLLTRALWHAVRNDGAGAQGDLDEAFDMAVRGPMRLQIVDIHLHRARLFFRARPYPWNSPQDDLVEAEKLIDACGYHRRDEELADAKQMILGSSLE